MKKSILIILFTLLIGAFSVLAGDGSGAGIWKITGNLGQIPIDTTCTIKQDDKKLTGECKTSDGLDDTLKGEINDKEVKWNYIRSASGTEIIVVFTGKLDEKSTTITGKMALEQYGIEGDFTAKKEEPK